jgi:hypothetical protein
MSRLNSLASVLAALDVPDEERPPRSATQAPSAGARGSDDRRTRAGYEIWASARRQAEFYAAYAEMLETDRRPRGRGGAWVQEVYPPGQWVGPAALATAYRRAAQHAALVDAGWATRLAVRSGMAYIAAGLPFGLCLLTGLLDDRTLGDSSVVGDLVAPFRGRDATDAVNHPVQLTYLVLAAASRPWLRDPLRQTLTGAERRLATGDRYPIGPQGVPLGDYLRLANAMRDDENAGPGGSDASVATIATRLADLSRAQAALLRAAQRNRYLWRQGTSPVAIIDLEQVAISGLALRHRPWFGELSSAIVAELDRDDELTQIPVWTMRSIDTELPTIAPTVTDIMREPDRAWRTEDFREPDSQTSPWDRQPMRPERRARPDGEAPTGRLDIDYRAGTYSPPAQGPPQEYREPDEDGGDDPYSADQ